MMVYPLNESLEMSMVKIIDAPISEAVTQKPFRVTASEIGASMIFTI